MNESKASVPMSEETSKPDATGALLGLALESFKFQKLFSRAMQKMDDTDASRFSNQHRFFVRRIDEMLAEVGLKFVTLEGQPYDAGYAVSAVNIGDFEPDDELIIDQMIEPIVMRDGSLVRPGTVTLRKAGQ